MRFLTKNFFFGINFRFLHHTHYITLTRGAIFNVKVKSRTEPDNFFQFDHIGMIQLLKRLHLNCKNEQLQVKCKLINKL